MANIVASGQITLVDLNDAKSLSAYINSNQPKIQIYNPDTGGVTPNWTASPYVVLTPELYVTGTATNIITQAKSVTWYADGVAITSGTGGYTIAASGARALTINQNKLTSGDPHISYMCEIVWTDTTFDADISIKTEIDFSRVSAGQSGADAITAVLSNDSQSIATNADGSGGAYGAATTTMSIFIGAVDDSANWTYVATPGTGVTGTASGTPSGRTYSVTNMTADTGYVDIVASKSGYGNISKRFALSKNKGGSTGQSATSYWMIQSVAAIQKNISGTYTPGTVTFSAKTQTGTGTPSDYSGRFTVDETTDGTTWTNKYNGGTTNQNAYTHTPSAGVKMVRGRLWQAGGTSTMLDEQTIPVVSDGATGQTGASAVTGILSNEAHSVPTDAAGNNASLGGANTTMSIYVGASDDSANWTVTAGTPTGMTGTLSGKTYTVSTITADTAYVDLTASKSGYSSVTKRFTVTKNKQGVIGVPATSYWLTQSISAIQMNISKAYTPTTVTFNGMTQTGSGAPAAYSGKFMIAELQSNGTTWTDKYTSASAESSKVYTPTAQSTSAIKALRVRLYLSSVTPSATNFIDEQVIPIVSDGATGQNAVTAFVWAPNGNVVKNGAGSVIADCDIYDGSTAVAATSYQWYKWDTTVTADQGGGVNWLKLSSTVTGGGTSGWTGDKLTIPADAVTSMTSFKCIAVYGGKSYSDVVTIVDQSDPIQVTLISAEGNVFRNGEGTKNITAKVYQAGAELDEAGTTYEYRWTLRKEDGTVDSTFVDSGKTYKTGKTLTVPSTSVTNIGNLVLELWTK